MNRDLPLLALAAFRCTRLVGWDDLTMGIRRDLSGGLSDGQYHAAASLIEEELARGDDPFDMDAVMDEATYYRAKLIHCPWCVGFWVSAGWAGAYTVAPRVARRVALPFALSALVGFGARWLDP